MVSRAENQIGIDDKIDAPRLGKVPGGTDVKRGNVDRVDALFISLDPILVLFGLDGDGTAKRGLFLGGDDLA